MKIVQFNIVILMTASFILGLIIPVRAQSVEESCDREMHSALKNIMLGGSGIRGYTQRLGDLTSSSIPTSALIEEVQQMARDARIETRGVCRAISAPDALLTGGVVAAYDLDSCAKVHNSPLSDINLSLQISVKCGNTADLLMDQFLNRLAGYLFKQAIRTSSEPLILKMRSLNARIGALVPEYSRLVNYFFTLNFRLGDVIVTNPD